MANIHINIGSNFKPYKKIQLTLLALSEEFCNIVTSSIYKSKAEKFVADDFYNIGVNAKTNKSAKEVIFTLKKIETSLGRHNNIDKNKLIAIDIDLILFDDLIDEKINLPRDEIIKYAYVLAPLAEINADKRHPVSKIKFKNMWEDFKINNNFNISRYNKNLIN